jgi:hypothetical protein
MNNICYFGTDESVNILFMIKILLPFLFLIFSIFPGIAQQTLNLSGDNENNYRTVLDFQKDYLYKFYYQKVGGTDELINGRDYVPYYHKSKLKPLLFIGKKHTASIILNGRRYNNITLEYDTFLDEVIYSDSSKMINDRSFNIALNKDPVNGFDLYFGQDSLIFRHFRSEDLIKSDLHDGFYESLYDGKSKFIIKHQSFVLEKDGSEEYIYTPAYYIKVDNVFSRIRTSKGFIKLFGNRSDEVKKFMRTHKVNIRKGDKKKIISVMKYYDSLMPSEK